MTSLAKSLCRERRVIQEFSTFSFGTSEKFNRRRRNFHSDRDPINWSRLGQLTIAKLLNSADVPKTP